MNIVSERFSQYENTGKLRSEKYQKYEYNEQLRNEKYFQYKNTATPKDRTSLDTFSKANQGSSDIVLTQMAVQFGYQEALKFIKNEIK